MGDRRWTSTPCDEDERLSRSPTSVVASVWAWPPPTELAPGVAAALCWLALTGEGAAVAPKPLNRPAGWLVAVGAAGAVVGASGVVGGGWTGGTGCVGGTGA